MMESKKKVFSLYDIVMIGLMAAVVFVVTMFLSIRIPTPTGTTMIKLANAFVLLCGLLLGPVRGGLAAGIGSMIFDLMTPEYAPEAWITFLRFFLMAWLCGVIAYAGAAAAKKFARNLVACLAGAVFSSLLYMLKGIIELMIGGSALVPAFVANIPKLMTSPPEYRYRGSCCNGASASAAEGDAFDLVRPPYGRKVNKSVEKRACRVSAGAFLMLCRKSDFVVYCSHLKKSTARRKTVWRILYRIIYLAGRR